MSRLQAGWRELFPEQRVAVLASAGIVLSMLLPWYQQKGLITRPDGSTVELDDSLNAFQAWGFVEASILLVAVAVIAICLARADRRAFHLPGGDGAVILAAGAWVMFLVFYRQLDRPTGNETGVLRPAGSPAWSPVGVDWGIFVAFALGAVLAWCGWRMRVRHRPEPRRDGDDPRTTVVEGDPESVAGPPAGTPSAPPVHPPAAEELPEGAPEPQTRAGRIARDAGEPGP
jgi:hypothetical protein